MYKHRILAGASIIAIISILMFAPALANSRNHSTHDARFVIASWDYPDEHGQGIYSVYIYHKVGESWYEFPQSPVYSTDNKVIETTAGEMLQLQPIFYLNRSYIGLPQPWNQGKNYMRHRVTVTCQGETVFSQQNFTYLSDGGTAPKVQWYRYGVTLNFTPLEAMSYFAKVDFEEIMYEPDVSEVDSCKVYNHDDTSFVDETIDANDPDHNDVPLMQPSAAPPQINDSLYVGSSVIIQGLIFDITTAGTGAWFITWEYFNGSSWLEFQDLDDETEYLTSGTSFMASGDGLYVTWTVPEDWQQTTVDEETYYWLRARVSYYQNMGTQPLGDQIYLLHYYSDWFMVDTGTLTFVTSWSESTMWAFNSITIIIGLCLIPASALYLVHGGRNNLSSDKVFYALVGFFIGWALVLGGILP